MEINKIKMLGILKLLNSDCRWKRETIKKLLLTYTRKQNKKIFFIVGKTKII